MRNSGSLRSLFISHPEALEGSNPNKGFPLRRDALRKPSSGRFLAKARSGSPKNLTNSFGCFRGSASSELPKGVSGSGDEVSLVRMADIANGIRGISNTDRRISSPEGTYRASRARNGGFRHRENSVSLGEKCGQSFAKCDFSVL